MVNKHVIAIFTEQTSGFPQDDCSLGHEQGRGGGRVLVVITIIKRYNQTQKVYTVTFLPLN